MDKLILTVNQYPWTSFFTFLMLYILLSLIVKITEVVFLSKFKNKE